MQQSKCACLDTITKIEIHSQVAWERTYPTENSKTIQRWKEFEIVCSLEDIKSYQEEIAIKCYQNCKLIVIPFYQQRCLSNIAIDNINQIKTIERLYIDPLRFCQQDGPVTHKRWFHHVDKRNYRHYGRGHFSSTLEICHFRSHRRHDRLLLTTNIFYLFTTTGCTK